MLLGGIFLSADLFF